MGDSRIKIKISTPVNFHPKLTEPKIIFKIIKETINQDLILIIIWTKGVAIRTLIKEVQNLTRDPGKHSLKRIGKKDRPNLSNIKKLP